MSGPDRKAEADAALARVARETEALGHSSLAQRTANHFAGRDAAAEGLGDDPAELWGRRIGRAFSVVLAVALAYWLGVQLRFW